MPMPELVKHGHWFKNEWPTLAPKTVSDEEIGRVPTMNDKWRLVDLFLQYKGLVTQHIDSYNHFVTHDIKELIGANKTIRVDADPKWLLRYDDIYIGKPNITQDAEEWETDPQMCRVRDLTYSAPIFVDMTYWKGETGKFHQFKRIQIGRMPVMLRSKLCKLQGLSAAELEKLGECPYDPGGYFIVKGVERVLMMQEQHLNNRIIVERDSKKMIMAFVQSSSAENKSRTVICQHTSAKKRGLYLKHTSFSDLVSVGIVMKAMGVQSDMELFQMVGLEPMFMDGMLPSLQEVHERGIFSQKAALDFLNTKLKYGKDDKKYSNASSDAYEIIHREVFSHIKCPRNNLASKIRFFGLMIRRVITVMHDDRYIDDRDYYGNKRIELSGQLISFVFEDQLKNMNSELKKLIDSALSKWQQQSQARRNDASNYPDLLSLFNDRTKITKAMTYAISTGNWVIRRFKMDRAGVSQVLSRFSYMSCIGAVMRMKSQFEKSRKVAGPRALQPSQWGMICPADTPEGEQCGLVKHLALLTHITTGESETALRQICYCLGVQDVNALSGEELHHVGNVLVFLNGEIMGVHRRPRKFTANLRQLRRRGKVGEFVSIYEHEGWNAIFIATDNGRLCRPLIIVADGKPLFDPVKHVPLLVKSPDQGGMTFKDFLKQGVVEWVDVNEENNLLIALKVDDITPDTTHLEIEPFTLLGVVSGLIPYPNHNQSPRNTYECAMGKQAMGCVAMNQFNRTDTLLLGLVYPQKPLCTSKTLNLVKFHHLGAGQNASVAVMSYSGYDIEDAIVMNRASLDRGFGRCFVMRRQHVEMKQYRNGLKDQTAPPAAPDPSGKISGHQKGQLARHSALGPDGVVGTSEKLEDGFTIANRITPIEKEEMLPFDSNPEYVPNPVKYSNAVPSYVDRVILTSNGEGTMMYKVVTRQTRRVEVGDKFASRHGQKGVVGLIVGEEDMPFSESGWRPDLIMNPHGFPSRMTVGKLLECIGSKAAVCEGIFANGSAFGGTPAEEIYKTLITNGFAPTGKEYLTSGITGEALESYIFCGPIYYQKLKHMVVDKMHARSTGPRTALTRQPMEGRAKEGGLRVGEMERDCLVAYGASNLLLERLMLSSDVTDAPVCRKCGLFCGGKDWCKFCNSGDYSTVVRMPYACKLLFQEMQSMNVTCRLSLKER